MDDCNCLAFVPEAHDYRDSNRVPDFDREVSGKQRYAYASKHCRKCGGTGHRIEEPGIADAFSRASTTPQTAWVPEYGAIYRRSDGVQAQVTGVDKTNELVRYLREGRIVSACCSFAAFREEFEPVPVQPSKAGFLPEPVAVVSPAEASSKEHTGLREHLRQLERAYEAVKKRAEKAEARIVALEAERAAMPADLQTALERIATMERHVASADRREKEAREQAEKWKREPAVLLAELQVEE